MAAVSTQLSVGKAKERFKALKREEAVLRSLYRPYTNTRCLGDNDHFPEPDYGVVHRVLGTCSDLRLPPWFLSHL